MRVHSQLKKKVIEPAQIPAVDISIDDYSDIGHLVGNGPSYKEFNKINDNDFVLGCNKPFVQTDASFICDHKFLYKIREKVVDVTCPVIVPPKLSKWIKTHPKAKNSPAEHLQVLDEFVIGSQKLPSHSSGHYGALWLARAGFKTIYIWGCDSLVKPSISSETDKFIVNKQKERPQHGEKFANKWRANWKQVVDWYPDVNFIFKNLGGNKL